MESLFSFHLKEEKDNREGGANSNIEKHWKIFLIDSCLPTCLNFDLGYEVTHLFPSQPIDYFSGGLAIIYRQTLRIN